jgi:precorrin-6B methylase 2
MDESKKYEQMWSRPEYRYIAPGEDIAPLFLAIAQPKPGSHVIDFGAGTGRGALMLAQMGGCHVEMLDFAENCLDPEVMEVCAKIVAEGCPEGWMLDFTTHDLTKPSPIQAEYGYCTDVMEHIPPQDVDKVLVNILQAAQHVFFQISCVDDALGKLIGHPLHLTVQPYAWWHKKLQGLDCVIHWSRNDGHTALFYVSAWQDAKKIVEIGRLNIDEAKVLENVRTNIAAGWAQVEPHQTNDVEVMILGGGTSLNKYEDEIRRLRADGAKLVTLNGTYLWALDRGLTPSAQIMVDARPFNARFTKPVVDHCKYLIASQCDPSVLEGLPKDRTLLWHTSAEHIREELDATYKTWWLIPGGSTVMLRAIPLLRMLGFKKFHLFGFDSCLDGDAHHAYAQVENDCDTVIPVTVGGRTFRCHAWQVSQAQEFMDLVKFLGAEIELEIYGDGLINHIVKTGADRAALADPLGP